MAIMKKTCIYLVLSMALLLIIATAGCMGTAPSASPAQQATSPSGVTAPGTSGTAATGGAFTLHVDSVQNGGTLPADYSCLASMPVSPEISWENVPAGTKTLTLIMEDRDAPKGTFTHWIVYNIPPERKSLPGGITAVKEISGGGQQGTNSNDDRGYAAVCPPIGSKHRYIFTLYAVDYTMGLPTADRETITAFLDKHWTDEAIVTTTFSR